MPRLRAEARRWLRLSDGVAAVEFALVLPIMVAMLLGMSELTLAVNKDRKMTILARSLADLVSKTGSSMTTTELTNIYNAGAAVMRPYDSTTVQMVVSSISVTVSGSTYSGSVLWSCGKNIPTPANASNLAVRAAGSSYTVPSEFQNTTNKSFVLVETMLPYVPTFGSAITGTIRMKETAPWPVRDVDSVTAPSSCPT